jgi:hypothetical protein
MDLQKFSNHYFQGWVDTRLSGISGILGNLNSIENQPETEVILDCRGRKIYRLPLVYDGVLNPCYIYLFNNDSLSRAFRSNYALHSMKIARKLSRNNFNTIEVLAALKPRRQILNWKGLLIAKEIMQVRELPSEGLHFYQVHSQTEFDPLIRKLLAAELARLHDSDFFHGDLKTRHILSRENGNRAPSIYFVDLEKSAHLKFLPGFLRDIWTTRDLIQLFASLALKGDKSLRHRIQQQFLEEYFSTRNLSMLRRRMIKRMLDFYQVGQDSEQGKTLAKLILDRLKKSQTGSGKTR